MNGMETTGCPIIKVQHLTAAFEGSVVIDDISFEVTRGEVFAILGGSGSGKSTLLKHMIGLYHPVTGHVLIEDEDIVAAEGDRRTKILKNIGVMYQMGALFSSMTLLENVRMPLEEFSDLPPEATNFISSMKLKLVGLEGFAHYMPSEISGGMQKRAAIARAMALEPAILFLDEPSAGLDPIASADLDQLILSLTRNLGVTFVVVTHELPSIYTIADRVIMLDKRVKKIVATGRPQDLRGSTNPWVMQFFNRQATARPRDVRSESLPPRIEQVDQPVKRTRMP